jgi:hypothetical protein
MDRSKIVAVVTGAIALILSIAYLLLVQILDFRGEMLPAPIEMIPPVGLSTINFNTEKTWLPMPSTANTAFAVGKDLG